MLVPINVTGEIPQQYNLQYKLRARDKLRKSDL